MHRGKDVSDRMRQALEEIIQYAELDGVRGDPPPAVGGDTGPPHRAGTQGANGKPKQSDEGSRVR